MNLRSINVFTRNKGSECGLIAGVEADGKSEELIGCFEPLLMEELAHSMLRAASAVRDAKLRKLEEQISPPPATETVQ
jgi:hypothetical protein